MNRLRYLIIHCSATPEGRDVRPADIFRMHTAPKSQGGRGWSRVGYSRLFTLDGKVHVLVDCNEDQWVNPDEITNGAAGYNAVSRHICYAGGMSRDMKQAKDTRTPAQKQSLAEFVKQMIKLHPEILVLGHNQIAAKACPSFTVPAWLREIGVAEHNIFK